MHSLPLRNILAPALILFSMQAQAQSVISAHAGLIHSFDGEVLIDGRTISRINGRFTELSQGSLLSTNEGKVEVLLGPGIFLWLGRNSAIRMQDNSLADARVELLSGSAVVQSIEVSPDDAVTLIYSGSHVRPSTAGLYRIDAAPSDFTVLQGEAEITSDGQSLIISEAHRLAFSSGLITPLADNKPDDLDQWAQERRRLISDTIRIGVRTENGSKRHPGPRGRPRFPMPYSRK